MRSFFENDGTACPACIAWMVKSQSQITRRLSNNSALKPQPAILLCLADQATPTFALLTLLRRLFTLISSAKVWRLLSQ